VVPGYKVIGVENATCPHALGAMVGVIPCARKTGLAPSAKSDAIPAVKPAGIDEALLLGQKISIPSTTVIALTVNA
jgi:hypothetical protein